MKSTMGMEVPERRWVTEQTHDNGPQDRPGENDCTRRKESKEKSSRGASNNKQEAVGALKAVGKKIVSIKITFHLF